MVALLKPAVNHVVFRNILWCLFTIFFHDKQPKHSKTLSLLFKYRALGTLREKLCRMMNLLIVKAGGLPGGKADGGDGGMATDRMSERPGYDVWWVSKLEGEGDRINGRCDKMKAR